MATVFDWRPPPQQSPLRAAPEYRGDGWSPDNRSETPRGGDNRPANLRSFLKISALISNLEATSARVRSGFEEGRGLGEPRIQPVYPGTSGDANASTRLRAAKYASGCESFLTAMKCFGIPSSPVRCGKIRTRRRRGSGPPGRSRPPEAPEPKVPVRLGAPRLAFRRFGPVDLSLPFRNLPQFKEPEATVAERGWGTRRR
jgi:hypothetical protein